LARRSGVPRRLQNERTLSNGEIETLVRWASTGAAAGDPASAPNPSPGPQANGPSANPTSFSRLTNRSWFGDEIEDLNINLTTKITQEQLPEDKFITAIEFKPGSDVVHHIIGFTIPPAGADARGIQMIGGIAPGTEPTDLSRRLWREAPCGLDLYLPDALSQGSRTGHRSHRSLLSRVQVRRQPVNRLYVEAVGDTRRLRVPAGAPIIASLRSGVSAAM
jgi:hypothetical protein